jgi:fermentation-respiration switch protein FrsA (DUF1100 family)
MTSTSATALPLPPNGTPGTADPAAESSVDFLRRFAGMMSGGRNAEMLLDAAGLIEALSRRATEAERLCQARSSELTHSIALREIAEHEADNLIAEIEALNEQLEHGADEAERGRIRFSDEVLRLHALAEDSHGQLATLMAEHAALRTSAAIAEQILRAAQMQALLVARAQFAALADNGDVVSRTMAAIGGCAIDRALADRTTEIGAASRSRPIPQTGQAATLRP